MPGTAAHFLNSATSGLHLAVRLLKERNVWSDGDEIIRTPHAGRPRSRKPGARPRVPWPGHHAACGRTTAEPGTYFAEVKAGNDPSLRVFTATGFGPELIRLYKRVG